MTPAVVHDTAAGDAAAGDAAGGDDAAVDAGGSAARSRRRWPVLVVLAIMAAAWVWWRLPALVVAWEPAAITFDVDAPAAEVEGFGATAGANTIVVGYDHEAYASASVTVTSGSLLGVDVDGVRLVTGDRPLLHQVEDGLPASVDRGGDYVAEMVVQFDNCEYYHEREAMLVTEVEVTSTVLGRQVVERVPLDVPVYVRSPMLWQCPDRVIDRQANNRTDG